MGLTASVDGEEEVREVEFDVTTLALCSHEAVHTLSAIDDQPIVENAINGPESGDWKLTIEAKLAQIKKLGT